MTGYEAYRWLRRQIEAHEMAAESAGDVQPCSNSAREIHVYKGIETLARAIGAPIQTTLLETGREYPVELSFMYGGYKIFQLEKKVCI